MLKATNLSFSYGQKRVLNEVSLTFNDGEIVGLIGPNGSGKTTLLRCLYGALRPDTGQVEVDGQRLGSLRQMQIAQRIAVVVQEVSRDLPLTVADVVLMGRTPHHRPFQRQTETDWEIATDALVQVGALDLAQRQFSSLSGGEKQRVLIARGLTQQCPYLLLDEPTNHLDIHYQHEVLRLVQQLAPTSVVVLHDLNLAAQYCDRLVLLDRGEMVAYGTPSEVLRPELLELIYLVKMEMVTNRNEDLQLLFTHRDSAQPQED